MSKEVKIPSELKSISFPSGLRFGVVKDFEISGTPRLTKGKKFYIKKTVVDGKFSDSIFQGLVINSDQNFEISKDVLLYYWLRKYLVCFDTRYQELASNSQVEVAEAQIQPANVSPIERVSTERLKDNKGELGHYKVLEIPFKLIVLDFDDTIVSTSSLAKYRDIDSENYIASNFQDDDIEWVKAAEKVRLNHQMIELIRTIKSSSTTPRA